MFDFIKHRKIFAIISSVLIVFTILGSLIFKIDMDITFKGGTMLTYSHIEKLDMKAVDREVEAVLNKSVNVVSQVDTIKGKTTFVISLADSITTEQQAAITAAMQKTFAGNAVELEDSKVVSATMGGEFLGKCLMALGFAIVLLLVYIGFRFKKIGGWSTGIAGVIALIHDVIIAFFALLVFDLPIDANFMAVILTILGYSINDSIVIFDRLRENKRMLPRTTTDEELINISLNQTFKRCILTSVTTIMTMIVVTVVALICNVDSILTFSVPMIVGLISGSYSSICITAVVWPFLNKYLGKKEKSKKKAKKA